MNKILLFFALLITLISFGQDGSLDLSFGDGGVVIMDLDNSQDLVWNVVEQADNKIIVSGAMAQNNENFYPYLVRFMPDGTLDTTFGTDGLVLCTDNGFDDFMYLFFDDSQNIIAAGPKNQSSTFVVAKYLDDGNLDTTFADNGIKTIPNGNYVGMTLLPDGSFLLLKFSNNNTITINHFLNNGSLNLNFGVDGAAISSYSGESFQGVEIKTDADNNIYFLGKRDNNDGVDIILMRFNPDGYLDTSFGSNGITTKNLAFEPMNSSTASLDFTNDNKIVIAGSCGACVDLFEPVFQPYFLRYNPDGSPDANFGSDGTVLLPVSGFSISRLIIQDNQRLIVGGQYLDCFEGSIYGIVRYFAGGTQDNSFIGGGVDFNYITSFMQADGKILSVGNTFWYNGPEDIVLLRHNNNPLTIDEFENQKVIVYPNPSNGIFIIERNFFSEKENYQITDITGKIIATGQLNEKQTQLDLSSAQSGVYFLKTSNSGYRLLKN
ncbi:T9SS type A sorting domain-containing protein [Aequorivita sinensis]|uniref:T9SS type A sorting domain-containing protein n=1 Tax=Aequorivita sinensis TaxID=1382458 RepID=UPI002301533E|nr:T9SS type A sorting domain-containing protein [Aequorivita sinensis]